MAKVYISSFEARTASLMPVTEGTLNRVPFLDDRSLAARNSRHGVLSYTHAYAILKLLEEGQAVTIASAVNAELDGQFEDLNSGGVDSYVIEPDRRSLWLPAVRDGAVTVKQNLERVLAQFEANFPEIADEAKAAAPLFVAQIKADGGVLQL